MEKPWPNFLVLPPPVRPDNELIQASELHSYFVIPRAIVEFQTARCPRWSRSLPVSPKEDPRRVRSFVHPHIDPIRKLDRKLLRDEKIQMTSHWQPLLA